MKNTTAAVLFQSVADSTTILGQFWDAFEKRPGCPLVETRTLTFMGAVCGRPTGAPRTLLVWTGGQSGTAKEGVWPVATRWQHRADLELQGGCGHGLEGDGLPVGLFRLLPHHHVEAGRVLVAEDETGVVVVRHRVHVERPLEVDAVEGGVPCR